ncbi:MAG: ABC transporter ATP-binding protein [Candidatus Zixiibacteriota bacterium]|nr:MAG: ABC transporter ATP-binding protein [candidate division Zixibacteria bacterium]
MSTATDKYEMIRLDGVSFAYQHESRLIENLSFSIQRGERVCLLGRNGSGKSTLLRLIAGLLNPTAGEIFVNGISTTDHKRQRELRRQIGFIFQNPEDQITSTTVETDIAFALENFGVAQDIMRREVGEYADRFELTELLRRHPLALSAGEKQRTALASVMVVQPQVLLLDEPTSYLDYRGRQRLLATAFNDRSYTIVGATQYTKEVEQYDRVAFLDQGRLLFFGSNAEFAQTEQWKQMTATASARRRDSIRTNTPENTASYPLRAAQLEMCNMSFGYSRDQKVIDGLSMRVLPGRITVVMGDSGCGKTTLALLLAGLVKPSGGVIRLGGKEVGEKELSRQVAVLFQFPETSFFADSVLEEVAFGIRDLQLNSSEIEQKVRVALNLVGLDYDIFASRNPFLLSAGERRRVAIASALIMERPIILFDETTLGLDWEGRNTIVRLLRDLKAADKTIVLMTHDVEFAAQTADDVVLMDHGAVVWQGAIDAPDLPWRFIVDHLGVKALAE